MHNSRITAVLALLTGVAGCVAPTTHHASLSSEQIRAEQLRQQALVIQSEINEQNRLRNLAWPMLKAAVPLCGQWITTRSGITVVNVDAYRREYHAAARSLGLSDTLTVVGVAAGSAAEAAGVRVGDRVIGVNGRAAPRGRNATAAFAGLIRPQATRRGQPLLATGSLQLALRRAADSVARLDSGAMTVAIPQDTVCAYDAITVKDQTLNAWADGQRIVVTTAMLRFADSDEDLAPIVAHEIAHNAKRHLDAKKSNVAIGAIFGALLDAAAASQGVNTSGEFTRSGAAIGAMSYSQDFEREADYVGMYILARSGRPFETAPNIWRRIAQESPGSIKYASSHPTSAERFIRLERAVEEIRRKLDAGEPLLPEAQAP